MKINPTVSILCIAAVLLGTACVEERPSYAQLEVKKAKASFPELTAWVSSNRTDLTKLAKSIQEQPTFRRLIWSRPPESFFTVILRDDNEEQRDDIIFDGPLDTPEWPQDIRVAVAEWHSRLVNAGCHGGFDDLGSDRTLRLFLDVNIYIAIPAPNNSRLVEHYANWAKNGPDPRRDVCSDIGGGWYLCTERR